MVHRCITVKLLDTDYNKKWFVPFKPNGAYRLPQCTNYTNSSGVFTKCSTFYHD